MGDWAYTAGKWFVDEAEQRGLATSEDMKFHAISKPLDKAFNNKARPRPVPHTGVAAAELRTPRHPPLALPRPLTMC